MLKWVSRVVRAGLAVIVLLVAIGIFGTLVATRPQASRSGDGSRALVVTALPVETRMLNRQFEGYGTARAKAAAEVAAEVTGRVIERPASVEAGESIGVRDVIVRIDPGDFEARVASLQRAVEATQSELNGLEVEDATWAEQVESSEREVAVARRDLERAQSALDRGAGNESQVDARIQALQAAQRTLITNRNQRDLIPSRRASLEARLLGQTADLDLAQRDLERSSVRSPIAGVLQRVDTEIGEWVRSGDPVARVVDLRVIEVPLRLPVSAGDWVSPGDAAELRAEGSADSSWIGEVSRVSPEADERSRSIEVWVEVRQDPSTDASRELLRPGRFVLGTVRTSARVERLVTPRRTVDVDRVLIGEPVTQETLLAEGLAAFESRIGALLASKNPTERAEAERLRDADEATKRAWLLEHDPALQLRRATRVRELEVNVDRFFAGSFPDLLENEEQWASLRETGVTRERALRAGQFVLLSNLDQVRPGMIVDVRFPGESVAVDSSIAQAGEGDPAADGEGATP